MTTIRLRIRSLPGSSQAGFEVELTSEAHRVEVTGARLPPLPTGLSESLENWKQAYRDQEEVRSYDTRIAGGRINTPPSASEIRRLVNSLKQQFDDWLKSGDLQWQTIRETLIKLAGVSSDETQLVLDFRNAPDLKRLPWQEWSLFEEHYPNQEAALRISDVNIFNPQPPHFSPRRSKVRILVVIGESTGINTQADLDRITKLQIEDAYRAEVIPLIQPRRRDLQETLLDADGYDLFVFVGHSRSQDDGTVGWLMLNHQDEISVEDFRLSLKEAIKKGLRLVIFNSCDGLGLAKQLADLNLSQCIVMKEPVPDRVAIEFLDRFLHQFAERSQPLLTSVHIARQGLEHFNFQYPNVTWLPTVCVRSNAEPLTWRSLTDNLTPSIEEKPLVEREPTPQPQPARISRRLRFFMIAVIALLVALLISVLGKLGNQQPLQPAQSPASNQALVSAGEERIYGSIKLSDNYEKLKQQGILYFKQEQYKLAAETFAQIREDAVKQRTANNEDEAANKALKDPEVLIYQNNALARLNETPEKPIYTIAAAVPLSDSAGDLFVQGQQMLFGIAQMQNEAVNSQIEQQQFNLQVVIANDLNVPDRAKEVAEKLTNLTVNGQRILAVVGHYISDSTCKALPVYEQGNLVVVSPTSTLTNLQTKCGKSNEFFRTTSSGAVEAETLVENLRQYLQSQGKTNAQVAIFFRRGETYSQDIYEQVQQKLPEAIEVKEFDLSIPNFDPVEVLDQLGDVDALFVLPDGANENPIAYNNAVKLLKNNQRQIRIFGSNPLLQQEVIKDGGGLAHLENKLMIASDWDSKCAPQPFLNEVQKTWFGDVNRLTALSYEAVQVLLRTLTPQTTSDEIQKILTRETDVESGVFRNRTISFDENGDRKEIKLRLLVTPSGDPEKPVFSQVQGQSCE